MGMKRTSENVDDGVLQHDYLPEDQLLQLVRSDFCTLTPVVGFLVSAILRKCASTGVYFLKTVVVA